MFRLLFIHRALPCASAKALSGQDSAQIHALKGHRQKHRAEPCEYVNVLNFSPVWAKALLKLTAMGTASDEQECFELGLFQFERCINLNIYPQPSSGSNIYEE